MNKLKALVLTGLLAVAAPSAYAIPFGVDIVGGTGSWSLNGPTDLNDNWFGGYSGSFDIDPGTYTWNISGTGYILAVWWLTLDGEVVYANGGAGSPLRTFRIRDDYSFTTVPEPATLTLLGVALAGLGFSLRRRVRA